MNTIDILAQLYDEAKKNSVLRQELLDTETAEHPVRAFCSIARSCGFELYEMELIDAGEEFYAEIKRSTNGGGENSPKLDYQDDFYEMFLDSIR